MPGGNLVAGTGGYLQFWNWFNGNGGSPGAPKPTPINYFYIDVGRWGLEQRTLAPPNWYSGCFGAVRRRQIANDWTLRGRVWWDYQLPPDKILHHGDTLALKARLGADATWLGYGVPPNFVTNVNDPLDLNTKPANGYGILDQGETFIPFYAAPQCVVTYVGPQCSSEGDGADGIIYQDIQLDGDSLLWYIDDQNLADEYGQYLTALASQNFLAYG